MENFENIAVQIESINSYFSDYANRQVNYAYTLRNWLIGMYLFEYEQKGQDRAEYGDNLYRNIANNLKERKLKGMSYTSLHTFKKFFQTYPSIVQLLPEQLKQEESNDYKIIQSMIGKFNLDENEIIQSNSR